MMSFGNRGGFGPSSMSRGGISSSMTYREKPQFKTSAWAVSKRLGGLLADYKRQLLWALLAVLSTSSLQMLMPWAFKHVIDVSIPEGNTTQLVYIGIGLTVMQGVRYALS